MHNKNSFKFLALFLATLAGAPHAAKADLAITPTIIVMEGRDRFADVNLINTGDKNITYDMNWRFFKMVDGEKGYKPTDKSTTDFDFTQNVVFTPRRVMLEPGVRQKVRLALRLKGEPPAPGDYRAHLEFVMAGGDDIRNRLKAKAKNGENDPSGQKKNAVGIGMRIGYSIPVIYRVGESNVRPVIESVTTEVNKAGKIQANVNISRTEGPYGVIGHLYIYHRSGGKNEKVGEVTNANIFPEIKGRPFNVPLTVSSLSGGELYLVMRNAIKGHEKEILAEKTVPIAK